MAVEGKTNAKEAGRSDRAKNYLLCKGISELALLNCKKKVEYDYKGLFSYRVALLRDSSLY